MPRVINKNASGKLLGRAESYYKMEYLQRLHQEWNINYSTKDLRKDLIQNIRDYLEEHPKITSEDRCNILACELDKPEILWQVKDSNGNIKLHAYPTQFNDLLEHLDKKADARVNDALARQNRKLVDGNAHACYSCDSMVIELDFPRPIGTCCMKASSICRTCLDKNLMKQIRCSTSRLDICCLECGQHMRETDVMALTTQKTFNVYRLLDDY